MMLQIIKTNVFKAQTSRFISESYLLSFIIQQKIYIVLILLITKPFYLPFVGVERRKSALLHHKNECIMMTFSYSQIFKTPD